MVFAFAIVVDIIVLPPVCYQPELPGIHSNPIITKGQRLVNAKNSVFLIYIPLSLFFSSKF